MNVAAIFSSFTARYARPARPVDHRIAIKTALEAAKAALEAAEARRDTRQIHACREALRRATNDLFRAQFKKGN
jgi:hypothetical protein